MRVCVKGIDCDYTATASKMPTKNEARRIAANIAKLPEL
jgi:hypothetical protein